ncbi:MAG: hypothetical protein ACFE85_05190 [Candidatus Hodarchaeota archaeon]
MFRKTSINSEEFIFYIDLITDFLKKKPLMKGISGFIKEKEKYNSLSSYGILIFQDKGGPITTYDMKDTESILEIINDKWDTREIKQSYLENGLFEILSYVFRKSQKARKSYRVIIISDTPSKLSEDYHTALYDLLIKAKRFDTFIDILRVGDKKFYEDDVKLKVISSETHSGVFYCNDPKLFHNILGSLVQSKIEFNVIQTDQDDHILEEDKTFYERLAVDLISLDSGDKEICDICEQELCPICNAHSDELHKCFNCNVNYHSCCAAEYSIANNIGFKHLFRCVQCDTLLKLDEDLVNLIFEEEHEEEETNNLGEVKAIEEIIEEGYYDQTTSDEYYSEEELNYNEEFVDAESSSYISQNEELITKKVRIGGFFGQEIEIKPKNAQTNDQHEISETIINVSEESTQVQEKISITSLKPPRKKLIKLCKICGATLSNIHICPNCGANLD